MRITMMTCCAVVFAMLGLLSGPASAAVAIIEAEGNLEHWALYASSHGPCAGASWSHAVDEGVSFDLQTTSFDESCVVSSWAGRCHANGLIYAGEIMPVVEGSLGWWIYLQSRITVLLDVTTPTRLAAVRTVEGMLAPSLHTVSVTLPGGATEILLGPDAATDSAERLLAPGVHRVTYALESDATWDIPFSYSGLVEVSWESAVGQDARTWGEIKCLYRAGS